MYRSSVMIDLSRLLLSTAGLVSLVYWGVRCLSGEGGWSDEELLALVSGALPFFSSYWRRYWQLLERKVLNCIGITN